jgi:hypothetical protein
MGRTNWTMVGVWWLLITSGRYVSWCTLVKTYLVFVILVTVIVTLPIVL